MVTKEFLELRSTPIPESGCWIWDRATFPDRYGMFSKNGKTLRAHRVSYEVYNGQIPKGLSVCHKCDIPECINPRHLFLGTRSDNQSDSVRKKRSKNSKKTHCKNGHPFEPSNIYFFPSGRKNCLICKKQIARKYYLGSKNESA